MTRDFSIVVPAYNEENNIEAAIDSIVGALAAITEDYEIIVINDGSRDRTGELAEAKASVNPRVKVLHNPGNKGYGYTFARGIKAATKTYISCFPGDNDMTGASLGDILKETGRADLIISYMAEMKNRSILRRILSRSFVLLLNGLFGLHLKYYNGPFVFKRSAVQSLEIKSTGLAIIAECLVKMLRQKHSYIQVTFVHIGRKGGKSTALALRSWISVFQTIWILIVDIYLSPLFRKQSQCKTSS